MGKFRLIYSDERSCVILLYDVGPRESIYEGLPQGIKAFTVKAFTSFPRSFWETPYEHRLEASWSSIDALIDSIDSLRYCSARRRRSKSR